MNPYDLCPIGLEKYEAWRVLSNLIEKIESLQVRQIIAIDEQMADQAYLEHVRDCELCGGQDE